MDIRQLLSEIQQTVGTVYWVANVETAPCWEAQDTQKLVSNLRRTYYLRTVCSGFFDTRRAGGNFYVWLKGFKHPALE